MVPIVIPGLVRFSYMGVSTLRPWAVVLHMWIESTGTGARTDAIKHQAKILNNAWYTHIKPVTSVGLQLDKTAYVDLDNLSGISGESSEADLPASLPANGSHAGDMCPGNAAVLMTKFVSGGRAARHGRTFWPGVAETGQASGMLTPTELTNWTNATQNWLQAINLVSTGLPGGATMTSRLSVPHYTGALAPGFSDVTGTFVQSLLATQRRRQRA